MKSLKRYAMAAVTIVGLAAMVSGSWACSPGGYSGPVESITVSAVLLEPATLIFIGESQNYFSQNGLNVSIQYQETGLSAVNAMLEGKADLACPATEFVLVGKAFNKENIQTIATVDKVDYATIVARKDRGIGSPSDLAGKKIGVARGTILEFRLGRFLELHGIKTTDVEIVNIALSKSADTIASGDIDAFVAVPPYSEAAQAELGDNAVIWPAQSGQFSYQLLMGKREWIGSNAKVIERFLKALKQSEDYMTRHPDEARTIVRQKLNVTDNDVTRIWGQNQFALTLDQSLIVAMEDEARWMMQNNLTAEREMPDFSAHIYIDGLKAVKPNAVSILR